MIVNWNVLIVWKHVDKRYCVNPTVFVIISPVSIVSPDLIFILVNFETTLTLRLSMRCKLPWWMPGLFTHSLPSNDNWVYNDSTNFNYTANHLVYCWIFHIDNSSIDHRSGYKFYYSINFGTNYGSYQRIDYRYFIIRINHIIWILFLNHRYHNSFQSRL